MIAKIPLLSSAAVVAALSGQAAAHDGDGCRDGDRAPTTYSAPAPAVYTPAGYPAGAHSYPPAAAPNYGRGYRAGAELGDLRRSDLNRDGVVTLAEALQAGSHEFRSSDHDRNRVLTRREVSWGEFAQDDRDRNGVVSYGEHQQSIRRSFYRLDTNRDGVLARYELGQGAARGAGWRR